MATDLTTSRPKATTHVMRMSVTADPATESVAILAQAILAQAILAQAILAQAILAQVTTVISARGHGPAQQL